MRQTTSKIGSEKYLSSFLYIYSFFILCLYAESVCSNQGYFVKLTLKDGIEELFMISNQKERCPW